MRTGAIVNPVSGRRKTPGAWPALLKALGSESGKIDTWWSEYPGHAESLAASARRAGYERIIAVGGDGTLSQVVNGLWWGGQGRMPSVGMVPFGTGCDYIRNFDVGASPGEKLLTAIGESALPVSLGLCRMHEGNKSIERVFLMVLGLGFDAEVIRRFRTGRFARYGWFAYVLAASAEFRNPKRHALRAEVDGVPFHSGATFFGAALGRYFGKGLSVAPSASPAHDRFELVLAEPVGRLRLLSLVFLTYFGAHVGRRGIRTARASRVALEADPPAWIEADGELLSKTPVEIELIPNAFLFAARGIKPVGLSQMSSWVPA